MAQPREKKQIRKPKKISLRYLKNAGTAYLQRFPASRNHFITVMTRKIDKSCRSHPDQDRQDCLTMLEEEVVPYFQDAGFLNDTLFANGLAQSLQRRGLPKRVIEQRMAMKGVEGDDITHALQDYNQQEGDWAALLKTARKKRCGAFGQDTGDEKRQKDMGKLARAGFSYQDIDRFLSMDADALAEML